MKRKLIIFVILLPAFVLASSWDGIGRAHSAGVHHGAAVSLGEEALSVLVSVADFASQITEETVFLVAGICLILLAWGLHRTSVRKREEQ